MTVCPSAKARKSKERAARAQMQSPLVLASLLAGQTADCAALALCDWRITDTIARSRCNINWTIIGAQGRHGGLMAPRLWPGLHVARRSSQDATQRDEVKGPLRTYSLTHKYTPRCSHLLGRALSQVAPRRNWGLVACDVASCSRVLGLFSQIRALSA